jgi:hypothetical protein
MIQLLIYDAMGSWRDMLTEADRYLAVTAADVQRVANQYLVDDGRNVAVYRTKKGAEAPDPAMASFSDQQRAIAQQIKSQLGPETDPAKLQAALAEFNANKDTAPEPVRPVLTWAIGFVQARIDALKGGSK